MNPVPGEKICCHTINFQVNPIDKQHPICNRKLDRVNPNISKNCICQFAIIRYEILCMNLTRCMNGTGLVSRTVCSFILLIKFKEFFLLRPRQIYIPRSALDDIVLFKFNFIIDVFLAYEGIQQNYSLHTYFNIVGWGCPVPAVFPV